MERSRRLPVVPAAGAGFRKDHTMIEAANAMTSRQRFLASAAAGLAFAPRIAFAQAAVPVRVIGFFSGTSLPLWVADAKGFFARENLFDRARQHHRLRRGRRRSTAR
jgi:hypothetical protein